MKSYKKYPHWKCDDDYDKYGYDKCGYDKYDKYDCMDDHYDMNMSCCTPKMKCMPTKECVKTYKCTYKLYRVCSYKLYKCCPSCGHEFDYHHHRGACPKCM